MFRKTIKKTVTAAILTAAVMTACGGSAEKSSARQAQENSAQAETQTETGATEAETIAPKAEAPETDFEFSNGVITEYTGAATSVVIPAQIRGETVSEIGNSAFNDRELTNVIIPNTVARIRAAFYNNQLTSVVIPNSVRIIDAEAFVGNPITNITIGAGVEFRDSEYASTFDNGFENAYISGGKRAGTYILRNNVWSLAGQANAPQAETQPASDVSTFTDPRDGQTYRIVTIGNQTWFAENLNFETENGSWFTLIPMPDDNNKSNRLYDWETALTVCPDGWRLPSYDDWNALEFAIDGGSSTAGKKMKSQIGWSENGNGTDDFGFSALPGGVGWTDGAFSYIGQRSYFWTSNEFDATKARGRIIYYDQDIVHPYWFDKVDGFSVRCIRE